MSVEILGASVLSPAGVGAGGLWRAMAQNTSMLTLWTRSAHRFAYASLDHADLAWPSGREWRDVRKYSCDAATIALGVTDDLLAFVSSRGCAVDHNKVGILAATGSSGNAELDNLLPQLADRYRNDSRPFAELLYDEVPDYTHLRAVSSHIGQFVAMRSGFSGAMAAIDGESGVGGLGALALACQLIESGELENVIVVAVSPGMSFSALSELHASEALASDIAWGSGPFDVERTGTAPAEAAAALFLGRSATHNSEERSLATLTACETVYADTRPAAVRSACDAVLGKPPSPPDAWIAHGSASPTLDRIECEAVAALIPHVPTTSSKGTIGNAFEASALIDIALAVECLSRRGVPPVGLLSRFDERLGDIDPVMGMPRPLTKRHNSGTVLVTALSHGAGIASAGAALVSGKP